MKDPIVALNRHDDLCTRLRQELTPPALPPGGEPVGCLPLTLQPIGHGQSKQEQGEHDVHPHRPLGFLEWMAQGSLFLGFFDAAIFDQAAFIVVIKWLHGFCDRGVGQEDGCSPGPIVPPMPSARDDGIDEVALETTAIRVDSLLGRPILVIGGQHCDADDLRFQAFGVHGLALPMAYRVDPSADRNAIVPAAAWAWASAVTAMSALAGITTRRPCWSSHHRSVPSKKPLSKTTVCRRAMPARWVWPG
jgi:hypothetical protein